MNDPKWLEEDKSFLRWTIVLVGGTAEENLKKISESQDCARAALERAHAHIDELRVELRRMVAVNQLGCGEEHSKPSVPFCEDICRAAPACRLLARDGPPEVNA